MNDVFYDNGGVAVEVAEEGHIQFDDVEVQFFQYVQIGIAAAKVVHPHFQSQVMEFPDSLFQLFQISGYCRFGDFHMKGIRWNLILLHSVLYDAVYIAGVKVSTGKIEADRRQMFSPFHAFLPLPPILGQDEGVDLVYQIGLFQRFNELPWLEQTIGRIIPPGQGFIFQQFFCFHINNRLVVHFQPPFFHGPVDIPGYIHMPFEIAGYLLVVIADCLVVLVIRPFHGHAGTVEVFHVMSLEIDGRYVFRKQVDSCLEFCLCFAAAGQEVLPEFLHSLPCHMFRNDAEEIVVTHVAEYTVWKQGLQFSGQKFQCFVAFYVAIHAVIQGKPFQVDKEHGGFPFPAVPWPYEGRPVVYQKGNFLQTGERIIFIDMQIVFITHDGPDIEFDKGYCRQGEQ